MNTEKLVKDLKLTLGQHKNQYEIGKIHILLKQYNGRDYLRVASAAFNNYLETKDVQYKAVFGIAITYARDSVELQRKDWSNLSSMMQESVTKYNNKHGEKIDWNRLPSDAASMKTMVFTIINRDMMSDVVSSLKRGFRMPPVVDRVRNFALTAEEESR